MGSAPPREDILVERDPELGTLRRQLDAAVLGNGSSILLYGDAGLGKTALVRSLATAAGRANPDPDTTGNAVVQVLAATASELEGSTPFGVMRRLLDRCLMRLDEAERARVTTGPAEIAAQYVLRPGEGPAVDRAAMVTSFYWLLDGLAALRPLLVIVDDTQWADDESLLCLKLLAGRVSELPMLLVVALRETPGAGRSGALAALTADRDATVLRLNPLTDAGVGAVLAAADADGGVEEVVTEVVTELTGGNPFLVSALVELLRDHQHDAASLRAMVPGSVVDSVVHRLAMSGSGGELARALAVLETAPLRIVASLAGLDPSSAVRAADQLRDVALLAEGESLAFRHALLRSAVLATIGASERDRLRREAARLLAREPQGDDAAAAQLMACEGLGDGWAVELLIRVGEVALAAGATGSAVALLRRALAEPPPEDQRADVLLRLGLAELRDTDPACVTTLHEAERLVASPQAQARCALALAAAYSYGGFHPLAADVLQRALGEAEELGDLALELEAGLISASLLVPDRIADARARLRRYEHLTGATRGERLLLIQQASSASGTNQHADVIRHYARAAIGPWPSAEQLPDHTEWAWARLFLAAVGEYDEVRRLADAAEATAGERGSVLGAVVVWFVRGMAKWWSGDLVGAEADFQAMLEHGELVGGGSLVRPLAVGGVGQTLAEQGRVEEALAVLEQMPEELPADAPVNGIVQLLRARAITRHAAGDHEGALHAAEECARRVQALDVDSPTWASWRPLAVGPLRALGRTAEAERLAAEELVLAERSGVPRILGQALRIAAEPTADITVLERAVAVLEGSGADLDEAKALFALGAAAWRLGRASQARPALQRARELADACGARSLVVAVGTELAATGARPQRLDVSGVGALTASELRVCRLAADGLRNREIAQRLFVTPKTVEVHLSRSYRKLGVAGREELAALIAGRAPGRR